MARARRLGLGRHLRVVNLAPNYRVITYGSGQRYVEAPRDWPRDVTDPDVEESLRRLCGRRPVVRRPP